MKVRLSYVTNSSSSSYVIAFKRMPEIDSETLEKYPFIEQYAELAEKILLSDGNGYSETSEGEVITDKKELDAFFEKTYLYTYLFRNKSLEDCLKDDDDLRDEYEEYLAKINDGFKIIIKNFDYDDPMGEIISHIDSDDLFVL